MVIAVFITTFILIVPLAFSVYFHFENLLCRSLASRRTESGSGNTAKT